MREGARQGAGSKVIGVRVGVVREGPTCRKGGDSTMRWRRIGILAISFAVMAIGTRMGMAQNAGSPPKAAPKKAAPEPEIVTVEVVNQTTPEDKANLKGYWTGVQGRTKAQWMPVVPQEAKPPLSTPGVVKIECWVHTDGRVTNMV